MLGTPQLSSPILRLLVTVEPEALSAVEQVVKIATEAGIQATVVPARAEGARSALKAASPLKARRYVRIVGSKGELTAEITRTLQKVVGVVRVVPEPAASLPLPKR